MPGGAKGGSGGGGGSGSGTARSRGGRAVNVKHTQLGSPDEEEHSGGHKKHAWKPAFFHHKILEVLYGGVSVVLATHRTVIPLITCSSCVVSGCHKL